MPVKPDFSSYCFIAVLLCSLLSPDISAQTDSALLASAIKSGRGMSNWFMKKTPSMAKDYPVSCSYYGICIFS